MNPSMTVSSTAASGTDSASATAGASDAGSGPSGGGTAAPLPDATASDVSGASDAAPYYKIMTAADQLVATLAAAGIGASDLITAARALNASAAPADSINQKLDGLHTRITQIEASTNEALSLAHAFAPFVQKLRHLFDVHFGGKLG